MTSPSYEEARAALAGRLGATELAHCERTAEYAERLARRHRVDGQAARLAGLLHDWDKEVAPSDLLADAERLGIPVTDADRALPYLLHAPLSAAHLREAFPGLTPELLDAVEQHTVGAVDMSPLAMVIYVADMLEPGRPHDGLDVLREQAERLPLVETFRMAYTRSVRHLVDRRRIIHPTTVAVWNSIVAENRPE